MERRRMERIERRRMERRMERTETARN